MKNISKTKIELKQQLQPKDLQKIRGGHGGKGTDVNVEEMELAVEKIEKG